MSRATKKFAKSCKKYVKEHVKSGAKCTSRVVQRVCQELCEEYVKNCAKEYVKCKRWFEVEGVLRWDFWGNISRERWRMAGTAVRKCLGAHGNGSWGP